MAQFASILLILAASTMPASPVSVPTGENTESSAVEAGTAATSDETAATPKKRMVCRMETATGRIMAKRVCRTPEQAELEAEQAKALKAGAAR